MNQSSPSPQLVSSLLIMVTVFHALAVILTSFRLWFRYHIRRLWWDDFWAALALICDFVCMVVGWPLTAPLDDPYTSIVSLPLPAQSRRTHIITFWLNLLLYTCAIWFARLSIVFSVLRIVPPSRSVSLAALGTGATFVIMWGYILVAKAVACARNESWYHTVVVQCSIPEWVAISEVGTDAISDLMLVALPLCLLWRVKLPSNQKIMILCVSSSSILVSVVSAVHTAYLIPEPSFIAGATGEIEGALSLVVCNLLVIVTFVYRVSRNGRDLTQDPSSKITDSSNRLTTVDLDFAVTSAGTYGTASGSTGSDFTGTNCSSVVFSKMSDKEMSSGSIMTVGGSAVVQPNQPPIAHTKH
ncbi:hypothetical protein PAXRUDRAFT_833778 [Paxillus rubicundulus Ve08.2h10]|uniref:Rhodopsin domain-containing protein n=1 Tax=Paxillus rubicundulus Ve08.2h10 TaxID=930991 RepID=A0A0D0CWV6_9AGAM|nr:hypothetical protein PAXRUDRAFT_833778 [Paxillus rubicundulus Ve08.2h10]